MRGREGGEGGEGRGGEGNTQGNLSVKNIPIPLTSHLPHTYVSIIILSH